MRIGSGPPFWGIRQRPVLSDQVKDDATLGQVDGGQPHAHVLTKRQRLVGAHAGLDGGLLDR